MRNFFKYVLAVVVFIALAMQSISVNVFADSPDAKKDKSPKNPSRVLHFPKDRSLGQLFIRDEIFNRKIDGFHYHMIDVNWESFGEARGTVKVPAGKVVRLMITPDSVRDLSPLSKLGPNDLYSLAISWVPVDDRAMQYVGHLSGLKILDLFAAPIGDQGMAYVARLKSLEYLTLPKNITGKGLSVVSKLPRLKGLYLKMNKITNNGLRVLSKLDTLEELELGGEFINDDGLQYIAGLPMLSYLMLWGKFTGNGFNHLREIPTLQVVNLFRMETTQDAGLEHLAALPALENLSLFDNKNISDKGMAYLANSKSLRKLDVGQTQVTAVGVQYVSQIETLEHLELPEASMTDAALESIGRLKNLKVLHLILPHFIDAKRYDKFYTAKGLASLDKLGKLEELCVSGPAITDESIKHITKHTQLKLLLITSSDLGDVGMQELSSLKSLESIELAFNRITIGGLNTLNSLPKLKWIVAKQLLDDGRSLDVGDCKELESLVITMAKGSSLEDEDLICLKNLKKLKELQTGISAVSDAGLAHLSGLNELIMMVIGGANVTDAGLAHLSNLKKLWRLNIYGDISDDGLRHLKGLKSLKILDIYSSQNISQAAIDQFKKTMPGEIQVNANQNRELAAQPKSLKPGNLAPPFSLKDIEGKAVNLADMRGKCVLLYFWFTQCAPCVATQPQLKEFYVQMKSSEDFVMLGMSMDDTQEKLDRFLESKPLPWRNVRIGQNSKLANDYGAIGAPTYVLVGPDGKILLAGNPGLKNIADEIEQVTNKKLDSKVRQIIDSTPPLPIGGMQRMSE